MYEFRVLKEKGRRPYCVVCIDPRRRTAGWSFCNDGDIFDLKVGKKLASLRCTRMPAKLESFKNIDKSEWVVSLPFRVRELFRALNVSWKHVTTMHPRIDATGPFQVSPTEFERGMSRVNEALRRGMAASRRNAV